MSLRCSYGARPIYQWLHACLFEYFLGFRNSNFSSQFYGAQMDQYSSESRSLEIENGHGREGLVKRVYHVKNGEELSSADTYWEEKDETSRKKEKELSIEQLL